MDRRQPESNAPETSKPKSFFERGRNRVIATGVTAAFAAAAFAGCSPSNATPPAETATHSAEATPSADPTTPPAETATPSPSATETEAPADSLEISAESSPEQIAEQSTKLTTAWVFAGADEAGVEKAHEELLGDKSLDEVVSAIANANADIYTPLLFADGWQNEQSTAAYHENLIQQNIDIIKFNLRNASNGMPLLTWESTISNVDSSATVEGYDMSVGYDVTTQALNNPDTPDPRTVHHTERFKSVDGKLKLAFVYAGENQ